MANETDIIIQIYRALISKLGGDGIAVNMRPSKIVGTVQDDPFDCWVEQTIRATLTKRYEIFHSGQLTTPDLVIRDGETGLMIGLEIKKLIQQSNGKDPRGLTLDYNSSLPCGRAMVRVEGDTVVIPCFYLFALLSPDSKRVVTLVVMDGDFLNYDFDLYKEAKYSNYTEYSHGSYGEGSVRHRKMYTYPNPINSRLGLFSQRFLLIVKKSELELRPESQYVREQIERKDRYGNSFFYSLYDGSERNAANPQPQTLTDVFDLCKKRKQKERMAYIPEIPKTKK